MNIKSTTFLIVIIFTLSPRLVSGIDHNIEVENKNVFSCQKVDGYVLSAVAENIDSNLPKKVSEISTWYKTSSENCTLKHFYRYSFEGGRIPESKIREEKEGKIRWSACNQEKVRKMIDDGVVIEYIYEGSNGDHIISIKVDSSDCRSVN